MDSEAACRHLCVPIEESKRGRHRVVFALQAPAPRAVVLVSKSGEVPTLEEENFHWIWTLEPAGQAGQAPAIVVSIQSQYWVFSSQSAWLTLCFLPHTETRFSLQLPEGAPEFLGVSFEAGWDLEDSLCFIPEVEEIAPHLRAAYEEFYQAYESIDGYQLSFESRGHAGAALTYGESHFVPVLELLQRLEVGPQDLIVDLGSGTGRVVLAAALGFPFVREVLGIELLPSLHAAAEAAAAKLLGRSSSTTPLRLVCGDFLVEDWSDATVVFAMSLCFPEEMMQALEAKFQLLKPGSYVILMHCFMGTEAAPSCLEPISPQHVVRLEISFGETPLYIFQRRPHGLHEMD